MKTIIVVLLTTLILFSGCCKDRSNIAYLRLKYDKNEYSYLLFCAGMGCSEDKKGETYEATRIELLETKLKQWCETNNCDPSGYEILKRDVILPRWTNDGMFDPPQVVYDIRLKMKED